MTRPRQFLRRSTCLLTLLASLALAADKSPDLDFLEFLGSLDAAGEDFGEYLEQYDPGKVAPSNLTKPAAAPVKAMASSSSSSAAASTSPNKPVPASTIAATPAKVQAK
jgi:hypothetical protein